MHYHIWVPKGTTQKQLREIYDRIAANHDIVSLSWDVEPGEEVEINGQLPATLASLKLAVAGGSMAKLKWTDGQTVTVDLFSASAVVSLYDALAPANQAKFDAIIAQGPGHLMRLVEIAFGNVKGCKSA